MNTQATGEIRPKSPEQNNNPFCTACQETDCLVSFDGTCAFVRIYQKAKTTQTLDLNEFKDAAIALCGSNAHLFLVADLPPSPKMLTLLIERCERLLGVAKKIQGINKNDSYLEAAA